MRKQTYSNCQNNRPPLTTLYLLIPYGYSHHKRTKQDKGPLCAPPYSRELFPDYHDCLWAQPQVAREIRLILFNDISGSVFPE